MIKRRRNNSKFFILNGVRRALVVRESGERTISAIIYRENKSPEPRSRMRLEQLYSPKRTVEVDDRYKHIDLPIIEPIAVEPLYARGQQPSIPLGQVTLE